MTTLDASGISKSYNGRRVLRDIDCAASSGDVIGVLGANGSGKSTLIKIIAGVLRPDKGSVSLTVDGHAHDARARRALCGLVAPYLSLYHEFTPREHVRLHADLHGLACSDQSIADVLALVQIDHRANDRIATFSSGMKQRVALACAVVLSPPLLLLDEPGSTLDEAGREICESIILLQQQRGGITVLATNDQREVHLCTRAIQIPTSI